MWPPPLSMQQYHSCCILLVPDSLFSHAILEMSVNPTEGEFLICVLDFHLEEIILEASIVGVIMLNFHAMLASKCFKSLFKVDDLKGSQCFV